MRQDKNKNAELEQIVKKIFAQNTMKSTVSAKKRVNTIIQQGLHELALRDLLFFVSHITLVMLSLLSACLKVFFSTK